MGITGLGKMRFEDKPPKGWDEIVKSVIEDPSNADIILNPEPPRKPRD